MWQLRGRLVSGPERRHGVQGVRAWSVLCRGRVGGAALLGGALWQHDQPDAAKRLSRVRCRDVVRNGVKLAHPVPGRLSCCCWQRHVLAVCFGHVFFRGGGGVMRGMPGGVGVC